MAMGYAPYLGIRITDSFYINEVSNTTNYIMHWGVPGMHWGVRKTQTQLGHLNLSKARTSNLNKWGIDQNNNVAYISGYSGSGKTTTALSLAKPGDKIIHLDAYSEPDSSGSSKFRNKDFDLYLNQHTPRWREMANATKSGNDGSMVKHSKEYWNTVDSFREAIENYGKKQFSHGHKVIVEGVQIADDWLTDDKSYYTDKPIIILGTNPITSVRRAFERDGRGNLIKNIGNIESAKEYFQWYTATHNRLNDLANATNAKRGQEWVRTHDKLTQTKIIKLPNK